MRVGFETALQVYERLPEDRRSPYFHPYYVTSDAVRDASLEPVFFVYRKAGEVYYHAFHLGRVAGTSMSDIQSPYAYGGPLSSTHDPGFLFEAWRQYKDWCRENSVLAEFIRFHPLIANWSFFPGEVRFMRETVWIDLEPNQPGLTYSPRVRTAIRKAISNHLEVRWVADVGSYGGFAALYNDFMKQLGADEFYRFPAGYFQKLREWQSSYLAIAFKDGKNLGTALFLRESNIMEYHLAVSNSDGKKWNASNLILDQAVHLAKELGCRVLHLGGGTDNRPENSLLFFKSGFSPRRASFQIGKMIHAPERYEAMQREWQDKHGEHPEKVLFYRFTGP
ncbi:MAG: hypothetical protein HPY50_04015 [Firmicutes bacterium]|nr:hypothetical protein [Bacillota bacterium]